MIERINTAISYLKDVREILSQAEFSEKTGVNPSQISEMLNGKRVISERTIHKIAKAFPVLNEGWLFTGEGVMLKNMKQTNVNGDNINGNNVTINKTETDKFLDLLNKKDEQIDRLLTMLEKSAK